MWGAFIVFAAEMTLLSGAAAQDDPASAESEVEHDEELARELFETGRAFFERAQYDRAAEAFQEAYQLSGEVILLVNVARAREAMGEIAEAITALESALDFESLDRDTRASIESRLARLRAHTDLGPEQVEDEEPDNSESPPTEELPPDVPPAGEPPDTSNSGLLWPGVISLSAGGALIIASIFTGVASDNIYTDLTVECPAMECAPDKAGDIQTGKDLAVASTVLLAVGAAASIVGGVLVVLSLVGGSEEAHAETQSVRITPGPGVAGAGIELAF